jgi:ribosomal-protein-alanine N-acetyltransferase
LAYLLPAANCINIAVMLLDLGDLRVRDWRRDDLDSLLRYANNEKIAANLRDQFPHPYTRREGIEYLNYVRAMDVPTSFAVEFGGEAVGGIGFKRGSDIARLSMEMGYWLGEPFWGRGLTTRGVTAASDWAFDNYKVVRIFAMAFAQNLASIRVLEKSGFECEGTMRRSAIKNGVILDQLLYAKVR